MNEFEKAKKEYLSINASDELKGRVEKMMKKNDQVRLGKQR